MDIKKQYKQELDKCHEDKCMVAGTCWESGYCILNLGSLSNYSQRTQQRIIRKFTKLQQTTAKG